MAGNTQLTDAQIIEVKTKLTSWGLLDPRFATDGDPRIKVDHSTSWNEYCVNGAEEFLRLFDRDNADGLIDGQDASFILGKSDSYPLIGTNKENTIIKTYLENGWYVARGTDVFNVMWIRDINRDWQSKSKTPDSWDDLCVLWQAQHNGKVQIIDEFWQVTTEPGRHYTVNPCNINGAARIMTGQYKAWQRGLHGSGGSAHQGFRQEGVIRVNRDSNKDFCSNDSWEDGIFYCNWHSTTNAPDTIGRWSAGCSVFRFMAEFKKFMAKLESDARYQCNRGYFFMGAYCGANELKN